MPDGFYLSESEVVRLRKLITAYENGEFAKKTLLPFDIGEPVPVYIAQLNSDVPGQNEGCPGKGQATCFELDLDLECLIPKEHSITVYNIECQEYKEETYVACVREPYSGQYFILSTSCVGSGSGSAIFVPTISISGGCGIFVAQDGNSYTISLNTNDIAGDCLVQGDGCTLDFDTTQASTYSQEVLKDATLCWDGPNLCFTKHYTTIALDKNACGVVIAAMSQGSRTDMVCVSDCETACCGSGSGSGSGSGCPYCETIYVCEDEFAGAYVGDGCTPQWYNAGHDRYIFAENYSGGSWAWFLNTTLTSSGAAHQSNDWSGTNPTENQPQNTGWLGGLLVSCEEGCPYDPYDPYEGGDWLGSRCESLTLSDYAEESLHGTYVWSVGNQRWEQQEGIGIITYQRNELAEVHYYSLGTSEGGSYDNSQSININDEIASPELLSWFGGVVLTCNDLPDEYDVTEWHYPDTTATVGSFAVPWTDTDNIMEEGGGTASITGTGSESAFQTLYATNFGFAIPSGATIWGIQFAIGKGGDSNGYDEEVYVISNVSPNQSENFPSATPWSLGTESYGGLGWPTQAEGWTPASVNDEQFGITVKIAYATGTWTVDFIRVRIYYVEEE